MQQHIASKKHKEKQLEWEELLAASCADSGGKSVEDDDEGQSNPANSILVPRMTKSPHQCPMQCPHWTTATKSLRRS